MMPATTLFAIAFHIVAAVFLLTLSFVFMSCLFLMITWYVTAYMKIEEEEDFSVTECFLILFCLLHDTCH